MLKGEATLSVTNTSTMCTWTYNIAWGDGNSSSIVSTPGSTKSATHQYLSSGFYTVTVNVPPGSSSDPNITCGTLTEQHLVEVPGPNTFISPTSAPASGSTTTSRNASFTYTSNVDSVTFECSLDGSAFSDCSSQPKTYSNSDLTDGQHTFRVRAEDANGLEDLTPATRTWKVDGTPPLLNITAGPDGDTFAAGSTQTWNFTASDATSGLASVQCSVVTTGSPASFGPCSGGNSSHSVSNKPSGDYTFTVKARDNGGLETTQSRKFSIAAPPPENTKPSITLTTPADGATYSLNQAVNANYSCQDEAGGSGIESCQGTVANGSAIDTASTGSKTFTVTATDNAGNQNSLTRTYSVAENQPPTDTTAPTVLDNSISLEPDRGKTGVARTANVRATFSEEMDPDTLTSSTFKLQQYNRKTRKWKTIPATVTMTNANKTAILDPYGATEGSAEQPLAANKKFRGLITTGAKDVAGNPMARSFTWIFYTGST